MSAMSRNPSNDVPPDILDDEEDESVLPPETGSEIEFDLEAHPGSVQRGDARSSGASGRRSRTRPASTA